MTTCWQSLATRKDLDTTAKFEQIAIRDIQDAADVLRPVYEESNFRDGYVSLEVSPYLARKTQETIDEARRLWKAVNRENVMIKVPGTAEGFPAIRQLIGEGININITLLFAQEVYEKVAEAYIAGLEDLAARGGESEKDGERGQFLYQPHRHPDRFATGRQTQDGTGCQSAGVVEEPAGQGGDCQRQAHVPALSKDLQRTSLAGLAAKGAQTQRVLWASTSTKNPAYRDVIYVEELIGPDTVNTMPPATIDAFRDHGVVRNSLTEDVPGAAKVMDDLATCGHFDQGSDGQAHR